MNIALVDEDGSRFPNLVLMKSIFYSTDFSDYIKTKGFLHT